MPYIAVWLTDLVYVHEGMADTADGRINVAKLRAMRRVLDLVLRAQSRRYDLRPHAELQALLVKTDIAEGEELYKLSLQREPKTE